MKKAKIRRKLKLRNFFFLGIFSLIFGIIGCYIYFLPIKNIIIQGNYYLTDYDIMEVAGIKDYPPLYQTHTRSLVEKIKQLDFVESVKVKKSILGRLTITIQEEVPLFYNRTTDHLIFASGKEIVSQELKGVSILVNYVPDEIYDRLLKEMRLTHLDVLKLISEIEYQPWLSDDVVIDDTRFLLRMNDGNIVYVNLINFDKLNNYMTIYSTLGDKNGILQLDSSLGNGITFSPF